MSQPKKDANCLNCYHKERCAMSTYKKYDKNGKPPVDCYGYCKEITQEDIDNSTWSNTNT